MTASSPRALTVINIMTPMIKKSISYLTVSFSSSFPLPMRLSYKRSWSSTVEGTSRTNEKTSTNGSTDGNHLHMSVLELSVQRADTFSVWRVLVLEVELVVFIVVVSW